MRAVAGQTADELQLLIGRANALDALAEKVQGEDEIAGEQALAELAVAYGQWYAEALSLLPEDLAKEFRLEYEGTTWRTRTRAFLHGGRQLNDLLRELPLRQDDVRHLIYCMF